MGSAVCIFVPAHKRDRRHGRTRFPQNPNTTAAWNLRHGGWRASPGRAGSHDPRGAERSAEPSVGSSGVAISAKRSVGRVELVLVPF